jgi:hypothetical protein
MDGWAVGWVGWAERSRRTRRCFNDEGESERERGMASLSERL